MSGTGNNFEVPVHVVKPDCFVLAGGDIFFPFCSSRKMKAFFIVGAFKLMISKEAKARSYSLIAVGAGFASLVVEHRL